MVSINYPVTKFKASETASSAIFKLTVIFVSGVSDEIFFADGQKLLF